MRRQFVNMLVEKWIDKRHAGALQLCLVHPRHCFHGKLRGPRVRAAANNEIPYGRFAGRHVSFFRPCPPDDLAGIHFASMGPGGIDILSTDHEGNTLLYDTCSRAVRAMPAPHSPKLSPVSVAVGDDLYLLDSKASPQEGGHPFEALTHCNGKWRWRSLPPPPFAIDDVHQEVEDKEEAGSSCSGSGEKDPYAIGAYTVVGDTQIWISTEGAGTYSFDTTSGVWSKAGNWALPFSGSVEYDPELGLWFGFSSQGGQFSVSDLRSVSATSPPMLQAMWDEIAPRKLSQWCIPAVANLTPLGSGKFCTVRVFNWAPKNSPQAEEEKASCQEKKGNGPKNMRCTVVITGVEVGRDNGGDLTMIRHIPRLYDFGGRMVQAW